MDFFDLIGDIERYHQKRDEEYGRLRQDPPKKVNVGDKVLVAAGLLGRGYFYIRKECEVTGVAQSSVRIKCIELHDEWEQWIDPALVTDIINKK